MLPTGRERRSSLADSVTYRPVDTLDAGRVGRRSRDALATVRARQLLLTAARRASGGAPHALLGTLHGLPMAEALGGAARIATAPPHYTRSRGRRATDGPLALLVLWPDVVAYGLVDALDARAASDERLRDVLATLRALVELLPTAARRALGGSPRASARAAPSIGSSGWSVVPAAPHAIATAPFTTRARAAVVLPRAPQRCSCPGRTRRAQTSRTDARAGPGDAPATPSLRCALVELLPTAARRALGSAPPPFGTPHGLVDGRGARAAPHAIATAPPHYTRSRGRRATDGRQRCSCPAGRVAYGPLMR